MAAQARAALHPLFSSPKRLTFASFGVALIVYAVQLSSGIPAWRSWSPVELSSNVVATMGLAWALIQLRTWWRARDLRNAWLAASAAMALLAVEGNVGDVFELETHGLDEMSLSIVLWLVASFLLFRTGRRYAMRRSVQNVMRIAFVIQIVAQFIGWWAAFGSLSDDGADFLDYINDMGELFAVLAYLMALLLAVFSPDKSYDFPLSAIGRKGREIYRDFGLRLARPSRAVGPAARLPVLRQVGIAARIVKYWSLAAGPVVRDGGPTLAGQLRGLLYCGAFKSIDPKSYYLLELFRARSLGSAADALMTQPETKDGLTAAVQRTRPDAAPAHDLTDRIAFARTCEAHGMPVVPILGSAEDGALRLTGGDLASLDRDLVVRDRFGSGTSVVLTFSRVDAMLFRDPDANLVNVEMAMSQIACASRGGSLIILPRLENHEAVARYARSSLVVFRVVTCLDEQDEPRVTHGVLRILRRLEPDWPAFPETQWGSAIDLRTGTLGPLAGDAAETCTCWRYAHPVTSEMIAGRQCLGWPEIAQAAVDAHRAFRGHVLVGWDIGWTPDGPVMLGGDPNMDFAFIQRCYGAPIGDSPLAPLLDAHLDRVVARSVLPEAPRAARLLAS